MLRRSGPGPSPTSPAGRRKSGKFGLRMKKMAHIKPILCVFGMLFYSSGYTAPEMHHQQANVIQTTRAGAWPVADLVGASSLAVVKTSPKNACWCRERAGFKAAFPCTTHTHHFPFVHLLNIQSKASMQKRSKNNAKRAPELHHFSHCFRGGWRSCVFAAPQAGSTALGIHGADSNALKMAF